MPFTTPPGRRGDLALETNELLDASGNFASAWLDTGDYRDARVVVTFNGGSPSVTVEEGQYDVNTSSPRVMRTHTVSVASNKGYLELPLSCRFVRLSIASGLADNPFSATLRMV